MKDHKTPPLTPEQAAERVREIIQHMISSAAAGPDIELCHVYTDKIMEELLVSLGYEAAVELIRKTIRWYA